jgi:Ferric uptake regulator family
VIGVWLKVGRSSRRTAEKAGWGSGYGWNRYRFGDPACTSPRIAVPSWPSFSLPPSPSPSPICGFGLRKPTHETSHGTVWRLLNALMKCGLAHREISPADGILRYGPVEVGCTHKHAACKDCGATITQKDASMTV